jgi:hypothetical protein
MCRISECKYTCCKHIHIEYILCGYPIESWVRVKWSTVKPLECHLSVTPSFYKAALFSSHKSTHAWAWICVCVDYVTTNICSFIYAFSVLNRNFWVKSPQWDSFKFYLEHEKLMTLLFHLRRTDSYWNDSGIRVFRCSIRHLFKNRPRKTTRKVRKLSASDPNSAPPNILQEDQLLNSKIQLIFKIQNYYDIITTAHSNEVHKVHHKNL